MILEIDTAVIWDNKLYSVQSWAQCRPTMTSLPTIQNKITLFNRNCTNRALQIHKIKSLPNQSIYLIVGQINSIFHPRLSIRLSKQHSLFDTTCVLLSTHNNSHRSHPVRASGVRYFVNSHNPAPLLSSHTRRLSLTRLPAGLRMLPPRFRAISNCKWCWAGGWGNENGAALFIGFLLVLNFIPIALFQHFSSVCHTRVNERVPAHLLARIQISDLLLADLQAHFLLREC